MIQIAARDGYAETTVARVIAAAGVSRPTFYDYFANREDCLLAALADVQAALLEKITQAVGERPGEQAVEGTIEVLVRFAEEDPENARFLMNEPPAGGPRALDARDHAIREIAQVIENAQEQLSRETATPDFSAELLLGTIHRLLAARLRHGEGGMDAVLGDLLQWVASYRGPIGEHRWRTLQAQDTPPAPRSLPPEADLRPPAPLPPGRPRRHADVEANQRQRILLGTAEATRAKGYTATNITDITRVANVDQRVFARLFANKQQAFMSIHELGFQRTMAVTAGAFVAGGSWPERIWAAGRAFTEFFERNPSIAHIGFVESYAVGADALKRVEDSLSAFTIFLQEGYQYAEPSSPPSELALQAIATATFEIGYQQSRKAGSGSVQIAGLLPHVSFISLAPFLGPLEANSFIDGKIDGRGEREAAREGE